MASVRPYRVVWAPSAQHDLDDVLRQVARRASIEAALRLYAVIVEGIDTLSALPARCRVVPELRRIGYLEHRELICAPYRIVFRIRNRAVRIVAVLDARRDLEELLVERLARSSDVTE